MEGLGEHSLKEFFEPRPSNSQMLGDALLEKLHKDFFLNIRIYITKLQTNNQLYNTTKTIPGGAKCQDYPLAFEVLLWSKTKFTVHDIVITFGFSTKGVPEQEPKYNN